MTLDETLIDKQYWAAHENSLGLGQVDGLFKLKWERRYFITSKTDTTSNVKSSRLEKKKRILQLSKNMLGVVYLWYVSLG